MNFANNNLTDLTSIPSDPIFASVSNGISTFNAEVEQIDPEVDPQGPSQAQF